MAKKTTKKKAPKRSSATKTAAKKTSTKTTKKPATKKKATTVKKKVSKKTAKKAPAKKRAKTTVEEEVKIDRRTIAKEDRREDEDRRQEVAEVESERREVPERRKVARRRQIDPTTCERDYSDDEIEFMHALDEYKRKAGRMFPTCSEILEVVRDLGYRRLTPEEMAAIAHLNPKPEIEPDATETDADDDTLLGDNNAPVFGEPVSGFPSTPSPEITDLAMNPPSLQDFDA